MKHKNSMEYLAFTKNKCKNKQRDLLLLPVIGVICISCNYRNTSGHTHGLTFTGKDWFSSECRAGCSGCVPSWPGWWLCAISTRDQWRRSCNRPRCGKHARSDRPLSEQTAKWHRSKRLWPVLNNENKSTAMKITARTFYSLLWNDFLPEWIDSMCFTNSPLLAEYRYRFDPVAIATTKPSAERAANAFWLRSSTVHFPLLISCANCPFL